MGDALHLLPIVTRRSALLVLLTLSQIVTGLHVHVTPDPKPRIRLSQEIARLLHISPRTAEFHKARLMETLGATSTADLVRHAIHHGLTPG